jgi:hypothetical protein
LLSGFILAILINAGHERGPAAPFAAAIKRGMLNPSCVRHPHNLIMHEKPLALSPHYTYEMRCFSGFFNLDGIGFGFGTASVSALSPLLGMMPPG